jgi:hypothetical protein
LSDNPLSDRLYIEKLNEIDPGPRLQTTDLLTREPKTLTTLKRSAYSQSTLLGFGKNKLNEEEIEDIKTRLMSP